MYSKSEQKECVERLREWLRPGDTVCTILRHVSRSRMQRVISPVVLHDGQAQHLCYSVARALDLAEDEERDGVKVRGCGMDMGFALVYNLAATLWPEGFTCIGKGCPANDHANGDRNYEVHLHRDGGYALRQKWL